MVEQGSQRKRPNILVTGTPGTGKTTMSSALAEAVQLRHINIGELVKEKNLHDGWDGELDCYVINEDLVSFHMNQCLRNIYLHFLFNCYHRSKCMDFTIVPYAIESGPMPNAQNIKMANALIEFEWVHLIEYVFR